MSSNDNSLLVLRKNIFTLIEHIGENIAFHVHQDKIDSQAIFALTKLIDILLKMESLLPSSKNEQDSEKVIKEDDQGLLNLYKNEEVLAPRAGLEPATKRLTAACSTTELPRN